MPEATERPTEQHYKCPNCKVPRFLAAASRGLVGTLRIKCPKCRKSETFSLATGEVLKVQTVRAHERELRCGGCTWFLAGVIITEGEGYVRVQCPKTECKRANPIKVKPETQTSVELPVG